MHKPVGIFAALLLLTACMTNRDAGAMAEADLSPAAARGKAFAQANCASCHAIDDGASPNRDAPSLRRAAHRMPEWMVEGSFERGVQVGHSGTMPVFVFEDDEIADLIAYFDVLKERELAQYGD